LTTQYLAESWNGSLFELVEPAFVWPVWKTVEPLIEKALDYAHGLISVDDVRSGLERGDMQLWLSWHENEIEAVFVTEIEPHPGGKVLNFTAVGGRNRDNWLEFEAVISNWASKHGCRELRAIGRTGWKRAAKGWSPAGTIIRKPIDGLIQQG